MADAVPTLLVMTALAANWSAQPTSRAVLGIFAGTAPCADCSSHRLELTLYAGPPGNPNEGQFVLRETFTFVAGPSGERVPERIVESRGRWVRTQTTAPGRAGGVAAEAPAVVYRLNPERPAATRSFLQVGDDELREVREGPGGALAATLSLRRVFTGEQSRVFRPARADAPDVQDAARFAVTAQSARSDVPLALERIVSAERQATAGFVVRLCLDVRASGAPERALAIVYRDLNGHLALSYWLPSACD